MNEIDQIFIRVILDKSGIPNDVREIQKILDAQSATLKVSTQANTAAYQTEIQRGKAVQQQIANQIEQGKILDSIARAGTNAELDKLKILQQELALQQKIEKGASSAVSAANREELERLKILKQQLDVEQKIEKAASTSVSVANREELERLKILKQELDIQQKIENAANRSAKQSSNGQQKSQLPTNQINLFDKALNSTLDTFKSFDIIDRVGGKFLELGKSAVDSAIKLKNLEFSLKAVSTGSIDANKTLQSTIDLANKIGINQRAAVGGAVTFKAGIEGTGIQGQGDPISAGLLQYARSRGSTEDQTRGGFIAAGQLATKGTLNAQDLNQLSDNITGIKTQLAAAIGLNATQLKKLSESGTGRIEDILPSLGSRLNAAGKIDMAGLKDSDITRVVQLQNKVEDLNAAVGNSILGTGGALSPLATKTIETITNNLDLLIKTGVAGLTVLAARTLFASEAFSALSAKIIQGENVLKTMGQSVVAGFAPFAIITSITFAVDAMIGALSMIGDKFTGGDSPGKKIEDSMRAALVAIQDVNKELAKTAGAKDDDSKRILEENQKTEVLNKRYKGTGNSYTKFLDEGFLGIPNFYGLLQQFGIKIVTGKDPLSFTAQDKMSLDQERFKKAVDLSKNAITDGNKSLSYLQQLGKVDRYSDIGDELNLLKIREASNRKSDPRIKLEIDENRRKLLEEKTGIEDKFQAISAGTKKQIDELNDLLKDPAASEEIKKLAKERLPELQIIADKVSESLGKQSKKTVELIDAIDLVANTFSRATTKIEQTDIQKSTTFAERNSGTLDSGLRQTAEYVRQLETIDAKIEAYIVGLGATVKNLESESIANDIKVLQSGNRLPVNLAETTDRELEKLSADKTIPKTTIETIKSYKEFTKLLQQGENERAQLVDKRKEALAAEKEANRKYYQEQIAALEKNRLTADEAMRALRSQELGAKLKSNLTGFNSAMSNYIGESISIFVEISDLMRLESDRQKNRSDIFQQQLKNANEYNDRERSRIKSEQDSSRSMSDNSSGATFSTPFPGKTSNDIRNYKPEPMQKPTAVRKRNRGGKIVTEVHGGVDLDSDVGGGVGSKVLAIAGGTAKIVDVGETYGDGRASVDIEFTDPRDGTVVKIRQMHMSMSSVKSALGVGAGGTVTVKAGQYIGNVGNLGYKLHKQGVKDHHHVSGTAGGKEIKDPQRYIADLIAYGERINEKGSTKQFTRGNPSPSNIEQLVFDTIAKFETNNGDSEKSYYERQNGKLFNPNKVDKDGWPVGIPKGKWTGKYWADGENIGRYQVNYGDYMEARRQDKSITGFTPNDQNKIARMRMSRPGLPGRDKGKTALARFMADKSFANFQLLRQDLGAEWEGLRSGNDDGGVKYRGKDTRKNYMKNKGYNDEKLYKEFMQKLGQLVGDGSINNNDLEGILVAAIESNNSGIVSDSGSMKLLASKAKKGKQEALRKLDTFPTPDNVSGYKKLIPKYSDSLPAPTTGDYAPNRPNLTKFVSPFKSRTLEDLSAYEPEPMQKPSANRPGGRKHRSVDFDDRIGGGAGSDVVAITGGIATIRDVGSNYGDARVSVDIEFTDPITGKKVVIRQMHLTPSSVKEALGAKIGQTIKVEAGQRIGRVGALPARIKRETPGTKDHMHFQANEGKWNGKFIPDPQGYLTKLIAYSQKIDKQLSPYDPPAPPNANQTDYSEYDRPFIDTPIDMQTRSRAGRGLGMSGPVDIRSIAAPPTKPTQPKPVPPKPKYRYQQSPPAPTPPFEDDRDAVNALIERANAEEAREMAEKLIRENEIAEQRGARYRNMLIESGIIEGTKSSELPPEGTPEPVIPPPPPPPPSEEPVTKAELRSEVEGVLVAAMASDTPIKLFKGKNKTVKRTKTPLKPAAKSTPIIGLPYRANGIPTVGKLGAGLLDSLLPGTSYNQDNIPQPTGDAATDNKAIYEAQKAQLDKALTENDETYYRTRNIKIIDINKKTRDSMTKYRKEQFEQNKAAVARERTLKDKQGKLGYTSPEDEMRDGLTAIQREQSDTKKQGIFDKSELKKEQEEYKKLLDDINKTDTTGMSSESINQLNILKKQLPVAIKESQQRYKILNDWLYASEKYYNKAMQDLKNKFAGDEKMRINASKNQTSASNLDVLRTKLKAAQDWMENNPDDYLTKGDPLLIQAQIDRQTVKNDYISKIDAINKQKRGLNPLYDKDKVVLDGLETQAKNAKLTQDGIIANIDNAVAHALEQRADKISIAVRERKIQLTGKEQEILTAAEKVYDEKEKLNPQFEDKPVIAKAAIEAETEKNRYAQSLLDLQKLSIKANAQQKAQIVKLSELESQRHKSEMDRIAIALNNSLIEAKIARRQKQINDIRAGEESFLRQFDAGSNKLEVQGYSYKAKVEREFSAYRRENLQRVQDEADLQAKYDKKEIDQIEFIKRKGELKNYYLNVRESSVLGFRKDRENNQFTLEGSQGQSAVDILRARSGSLKAKGNTYDSADLDRSAALAEQALAYRSKRKELNELLKANEGDKEAEKSIKALIEDLEKMNKIKLDGIYNEFGKFRGIVDDTVAAGGNIIGKMLVGQGGADDWNALIAAPFKAITNELSKYLTSVLSDIIGNLLKDVVGDLNDIMDSAGSASGGAERSTGSKSWLGTALNFGVKWLTGSLGGGSNLGDPNSLDIPGYAIGGVINPLLPISPKDNRLILARDGEGILVPGAVKALGGAMGIDKLNSMFAGAFADGGVVGNLNSQIPDNPNTYRWSDDRAYGSNSSRVQIDYVKIGDRDYVDREHLDNVIMLNNQKTIRSMEEYNRQREDMQMHSYSYRATNLGINRV